MHGSYKFGYSLIRLYISFSLRAPYSGYAKSPLKSRQNRLATGPESTTFNFAQGKEISSKKPAVALGRHS